MSEEKKQDGPPRAVFADGRLTSAGIVDDPTLLAINTELDRLRVEAYRLRLLAADGLQWYHDLLEAVTDESTVH